MPIVYAGWDRISQIHWDNSAAGSIFIDVDVQVTESSAYGGSNRIVPRNLYGYQGANANSGDLLALPVMTLTPSSAASERRDTAATGAWLDAEREELRARLTTHALGSQSLPCDLFTVTSGSSLLQWVYEIVGPTAQYQYHYRGRGTSCEASLAHPEWGTTDEKRLVTDDAFDAASRVYYPIVDGAIGSSDPLATQVAYWLEQGLSLLDTGMGKTGERPWSGASTKIRPCWSDITRSVLQSRLYGKTFGIHPRFTNFIPVALPVPIRVDWAATAVTKSLCALAAGFRRWAESLKDGRRRLYTEDPSLIIPPGQTDLKNEEQAVPGLFGLFRVESVETVSVARHSNLPPYGDCPPVQTLRTTATAVGLIASGLGWLETPKYAYFDAFNSAWAPGIPAEPDMPVASSEVDPVQVRQVLTAMGDGSVVELPTVSWEAMAEEISDRSQKGDSEDSDIFDAIGEEGLVSRPESTGKGYRKRTAFCVTYDPVRAKRSKKARATRRARQSEKPAGKAYKRDFLLFRTGHWRMAVDALIGDMPQYLPAFCWGTWWPHLSVTRSGLSGMDVRGLRNTFASLLAMSEVWAPGLWRTRPVVASMVEEFHSNPVQIIRWVVGTNNADGFSWELLCWFYQRHLDIKRGRLPARTVLPRHEFGIDPGALVRSPRRYDLENLVWGYSEKKVTSRREAFILFCKRILQKDDERKQREQEREKSRRRRQRARKSRKKRTSPESQPVVASG